MPFFKKSEFNVEITDEEIRSKDYIKPEDCPTTPPQPCPPPTDDEIRALGYIKPEDCPDGPPTEPPIDPPTDLEELAFNTSEGTVDFDLKGINPADWPTERLKEENKDDISEGKFVTVNCGVGRIKMHPQTIVGDITLTPEGFVDFKADWERDKAGRPRHHHTEFAVYGDGWRDDGRSMPVGEWTKQVTKYVLPNFINDDQWKVIGQYHGWSDGGEAGGRNPNAAISLRERHNGGEWITRADSKPVTVDKNYTRQESWNELVQTPLNEDVTIIVESYTLHHHTFGAQKLIVNGNVIVDEANIGNMFNDQRGPIWSMGIYKYFSSTTTPTNHLIVERAMSMRVNGPRAT